MGQEELSGAGTASPTRHVRSRLSAWSWGEPLAKERREMGLFHWQEAGGCVDEWVRGGESKDFLG